MRKKQSTKALQVVAGAGPAGLATAQALLERGHRVRIVCRKARPGLLSQAEWVLGDLSRTDFAQEAMDGATTIYQCLGPAYHRWVELFPPLQDNLVQAAMKTGANYVSLENFYLYGESEKPHQPSHNYQASTRKGELRGRMAQALYEHHQRGELSVAWARAADFFGPGVLQSSLGQRVMDRLLEGKDAQLLGNPELPHSYSYIEDVGRGLAAIGTREEAFGRVWHLPVVNQGSAAELLKQSESYLGMPLKYSRIPGLFLWLLGTFQPEVKEIREMMYLFEKPFLVDDSEFRQFFAMEATAAPVALERTLKWYENYLRQAA